MITLRNISKSFGAQTLIENASLQINTRDRFALVGPNGAGKSTLFKIIMGTEPLDGGEVSLRSGVRFAYLPQETPHLLGKLVLEETLGEEGHDNRREAWAKKILMGLGFKITDFSRPVSELSGGWQMRVMIAKLLLDEPDLLMLDEPTNHLDLESLLWFQNHLRSFKGALFIISHDREFINAVTERIVEVRNHQLNIYNGTFEHYLAQKKKEEEDLISAYKRQQKEIEDLEIFISRFRAKASLAASVQSKIKYLERMERIELPPEQKTVGFSFPQPKRSGHNVLVLKNIRQSYDGIRYVYDGLDLTLERGQKIAFVGPNGAGKSTLLKLLAGQIPFQSGERKLGFDVEVGYFSQHRAAMFKSGRTVFEEACDTRRAHSETTIRTILGSFLFQGDMVFKKVDVLSGGEKSRLGLAKLLLDPPNFMLMDEPTTHLDIASVERLIEALKAYEGTLCMISHDVYFLKQLADNVLHVNQGKVTLYPGGYDYFLHKKSLEEGEEADLFRSEEAIEASVHEGETQPKPSAPQAGSSGRKTKEQKRKEAEERNARYRQLKEGKTPFNEKEQWTQEENEILTALGNPDTHKDPSKIAELTRRLGDVQKKLKTLL
ncbi:MAG: putative ABC transporter ATP-binding protein YheS [Elusimicrobia bacterium]|nr:putative ABC transporter ATP-binding protein YheS [Elusimicrobiota bacterium]